MILSELLSVAEQLPFDTMYEIYSNGVEIVTIYRPSTLPTRFKNYDVNKNFQIFLKEKNHKEFKPNHFRVLLDLKLRVREIPDSKLLLSEVFDKIFYGNDPIDSIKPIFGIHYTQFINTIDITAVLAQLFIAEQLINYNNTSKYNPSSLYIQGWIRSFIMEDKEIDDIVYRIARNTPPPVKFTCQDDKNHKKYNPNAKPLWYI